MSVTIGPFTLTGTDAQNDRIVPMTKNLAAKLALPGGQSRLEPITVVFVPNDDMPWAREPGTDGPGDKGARALGYWRVWPHKILMANHQSNIAKRYAHEVMHALDSDWLEPAQRQEIKALMVTVPSSWRGETFAIYGSAAIGGFSNPTDADFYGPRTVPQARWPELKEIALRDELREQITELRATVVKLGTEIADLHKQLDECAAANAELTAEVARLTAIVDDVKAAVS